jgi:glycosyltransferase involved in cell wall biosynthesis
MNKISVIVPCYNQGQYLTETLDSVYNQTFQNWECIIVDDDSPDNTKAIAEDFCKKDDRFVYLHKTNGGLSSARNFGIKHSTGYYILPLDSDDKIHNTFLEKAFRILESNSDIKVVYSRVMAFGSCKGEFKLPSYSLERLMGQNCIVCTALYRKEDYDKTVGYNENMKYGFEDWDFWLSMMENGGRVYQIPEFLFFYRQKEKSMVKNITIEQCDYLRRTIWENHRKLYSELFLNPRECMEYCSLLDSIEYKIGSLFPKWAINIMCSVYNWFKYR